ncbi:rhodanese-like domain-containing protein [Sulfurospirillum arsenophilum]|uniref:rhodanese-like domain-containing protein n=1 Tax=Sulfurospirillum arsenophilum TaxID=56698 RepID=UPI0005A6FE57|nr:rhodanese-like domain-containing protein [Sulfurospirillum arsenophilum]
MKKVLLSLFVLLGFLQAVELKKVSFEEYLLAFDYKERENMKIKTPDMLALIEEGKAILVDVRFREEFEVWHMNFAKNIPLNELPKRLGELPKDKLIITACPHNDRSNLARLFLVMNGYNAKYLNDGLLKTADFLRGENAKEFLEEYQSSKEKK